MFKETDKNAKLDIFSMPAEHLRGSSQKFYLENDSWHRIFRKEVLVQINEQIFSVLYCKDNGTPNASIRVLVAMMLLKESQGWSDDQLFENCSYNMLAIRVFSLLALDDTPRVPSVYYHIHCNIIDAQLPRSYKKPEERIWKIKDDNGKWRYFTLENFRTSLLRQKLRDTPKEERNMRNNVRQQYFKWGFIMPITKQKSLPRSCQAQIMGLHKSFMGELRPIV